MSVVDIDWNKLRVAYAPFDPSLRAPGDRRRFAFYARARGIEFELASPDGEYDIVVLSSVADITRWNRPRRSRPKIVYDLIDSYLALPPTSLKSRLRGPAKFLAGEIAKPTLNYHRAIERMCSQADVVICSTAEQREMIQQFCGNVHVILDHHGELGDGRKTSYENKGTINIAWEGLPQNLTGFGQIKSALRDLQHSHNLAFHLVTDLEFAQFARRFRTRRTDELASSLFHNYSLHQWDTRTVAELITACDIAVIPLDLNDPLARGKPENKLLLLWSLGMPVITSATPAYSRAMERAGLSMVCESPADWSQQLNAYANSEQLRREAGEAGRRYVETHHARETLLERWDAVFASILIQS